LPVPRTTPTSFTHLAPISASTKSVKNLYHQGT
jgi:hypothetical protein